jgi:hypothetical protein
VPGGRAPPGRPSGRAPPETFGTDERSLPWEIAAAGQPRHTHHEADHTSTTRAGASGDRGQAALNFAKFCASTTSTLPDPQFAADGSEYQFPERVRDDPKLKAAGQACGQSLPPRQAQSAKRRGWQVSR